jgi:phenylalanyl-tRNA synthetase alpha chain
MREQLETIAANAMAAIQNASSTADLDRIHTLFLGKKGALTDLLKKLPGLSLGDRSRFGQEANALKERVAAAIEARKESLSDALSSVPEGFDTIRPRRCIHVLVVRGV